MIEYQIRYKDTQRASGDEDNQIKGISITDLGTYGLARDPVTTNVQMGFGSSSVIISANDTVSTYDELVAFFTGSSGRKIRITGGSTDGDYTIIDEPIFTAPVLEPVFIHGNITFHIDAAPVPGTPAVDGIQIEDITTPDIVQLQGSGSPDTLQVIDNDENKFATIKAKQLTIQFIATASVDINTFAKGEDNKWYVESWTNTRDNIDFKGFLITDDLQQPFLPVQGNIVVTLLATDRLGTLKAVQLSDNNKIPPLGKYKISQFLSWILKKTGMSLPIYVVNNIKLGSGSFTTDVQFDLSDVRNVGMNDNITSQRFFYPGQRVRITGSAGNDGTYTVLFSVLFGIRLIYFDATFSAETTPNVTFEDVSSDTHLYDTVYLDAKTFEGNEVGTTINCYDSLDVILRYNCSIELSKGSWWIYRIGEFEGTSVKVAHFEADGTFVDIQTKTYSKSIGRDETIKWIDASGLLRLRRPYSSIKLTFNFENPLELICNTAFLRGDFIENMSQVTEGDAVYDAKKYAVDDWVIGRYNQTSQDPASTTTVQAFTKVLSQNGYEKQRYLAMTASTDADPFAYLRSCPLRVNVNDKFSVSYDFKFSSGTADDNYPMVGIMLFGDNGHRYQWNHGVAPAGLWVDVTALLPDTTLISCALYPFTDNDSKLNFSSFATSVLPCPSAGLIYLYMQPAYVVGAFEAYYNNLNFTYIPFINGSYERYKAQYHQVSQAGSYNATLDDVVYMSDGISYLTKGSMFFFNGTSYFLTQIFYDSFKFPVPSGDDLKPYGEIQAQDVWTQFNREMRIFSGTLRGLDSDVQDSDDLPDGPDLIHQYLLTDSSESTNNKVFLMISCEQDRKSQFSQSTLIEVFDSVEGKTPGTHLFKYLTE